MSRPARRPPGPYRRAAAPATLVVLATAGLVAVGSSPAHAVMLGAGALAVVLVWVGTGYAGDATWPRLPAPARDGARRDVSDLGWAILGRDGRVTDRAVRRVRAIADHHLARHGVHGDLARPDVAARAEDLLGPRTARGLHDHATRGTTPTPRDLQLWIEAVDRLAATPPDEGNPR